MTDAEIAALLDGTALVLILIGALLCVTAAIGLALVAAGAAWVLRLLR